MKDEATQYEEFDKSPLAKSEEKIAKFWVENEVFKKSVEKDAPNGEFIFYEGPPTANGRPGIHHLESRSFKDAIPRYKTMQGYHVARRAGWDTHGLPVELEVEKQLGFNGKPDIEKYGIAEFNQKCRESVLKYVDEWQAFTDRIGYWVDHDSAYYTFNLDYMESVWWVFSQAAKNDLLYKDYKVLPWCSRCGTALSSHELAQGYKTVKDLSITAKFELVNEPGTFILAWTTTPWTLPGNVALAVGKDIDYVKVFSEGEYFILAKDLVDKVFQKAAKEYEVIAELPGSDLVGLRYKSLYPYLSDLITGDEKTALQDKAYQVYAADFVTTEDGTGVVHTAVMYGQDDFVLGNEIGLPKFHLVNEEGNFISGTDFLAGRFVKDEQVAIDIIRDLALRNEKGEEKNNGPILLFDKEKYEHTYPHCWRCKTPLIYYARDSWYIAMSGLRNQLLQNNEAINWEPDYIKDGRMGEWLRGVKDWAVSRERYWGTPLPVWESDDGDRIIVDSIKTLREHARSMKNKYVLIRHGESTGNAAGVISAKLDSDVVLTENGQKQTEAIKDWFEEEGITPDLVFYSPLKRTAQTAEIAFKNSNCEMQAADEICEVKPGDYEGRSLEDWHNRSDSVADKFYNDANSWEAYDSVRQRIQAKIIDLERQYNGKTIVIVSHDLPLKMVKWTLEGFTESEIIAAYAETHGFANAAPELVVGKSLPRDESGEINLHRPYVDEVVLEKNGKVYHRTPEVMDVWFDSGSMPWAQDHYPFENKDWIEGAGYPGDYISEAIDQTRGWFYVLQAIAAFQGLDQAPYKNVICLGHILDAEGQKMSKSKGNTVNPWEMIAKYGADALRFWMYSVNQPGEPKNFDEQTVDEIVKKVFNLLRNSLSFYQMFADSDHSTDPYQSPHVLDKWLLARFAHAHQEVTTNVDDYKLLEATREIRDLIGDLSQWYIRRSRDRFKGEDATDRSYALGTTKFVITEIAKLLAPFTPYLAEELWQELGNSNSVISVHLADWSEIKPVDQKLLVEMKRVRDLASTGLALRQQADINARQPLGSFTYPGEALSPDLAGVLADELNVKEVLVGDEVSLDTELSQELIAEGEYRELLRATQSLRKKYDLIPDDRISLQLESLSEGQEKQLANWREELELIAGVTEIQTTPVTDKTVTVDFAGQELTFGIKKLD